MQAYIKVIICIICLIKKVTVSNLESRRGPMFAQTIIMITSYMKTNHHLLLATSYLWLESTVMIYMTVLQFEDASSVYVHVMIMQTAQKLLFKYFVYYLQLAP